MLGEEFVIVVLDAFEVHFVEEGREAHPYCDSVDVCELLRQISRGQNQSFLVTTINQRNIIDVDLSGK